MLVLLSFALVVVATVLLALGLLNDDGLTLIYLSIAASLAAGVVLLVALRRHKPRPESASAPAPAPAPRPRPQAPVPDPAPAPPAVTPVQAAATTTERHASELEPQTYEVDFPIADYDDLTTGQILPLLPQLYADEIGVVEEREHATKGRPEILDRLAQLRGDDAATTVAATEPPDTKTTKKSR